MKHFPNTLLSFFNNLIQNKQLTNFENGNIIKVYMLDAFGLGKKESDINI